MNFTKSELEMLYQYAAPTKEETLAGLKEIVPVLEKKDDLLSKVIVENTIRKLEKLAEPECSRLCRGMTWQAWSGSCRKQGTW